VTAVEPPKIDGAPDEGLLDVEPPNIDVVPKDMVELVELAKMD